MNQLRSSKSSPAQTESGFASWLFSCVMKIGSVAVRPRLFAGRTASEAAQDVMQCSAYWQLRQPGMVRIEIISHDGGQDDTHLQSMDLRDDCTGWSESQAFTSQAKFADVLEQFRLRLPFGLRGIDLVCANETLHSGLQHYCAARQLLFTRKHIAGQQHSDIDPQDLTVLRCAVGYRHYDTPAQLTALNDLYRHLRRYTNHFVAIRKPALGMLDKLTRQGGALTPYQRLLRAGLPPERKEKLLRYHDKLHDLLLMSDIKRLQGELDDIWCAAQGTDL